MSLRVTRVRFTPAPERLRPTGLLGWASFLVAESVRIEVAVRQTARGRLSLVYPLRQDCVGREHYAARPIDDRARCAIERAVFAAIEDVLREAS